ncbi:ABC transporter permease subunit [Isoptericola haloaureus]|uniref:ABC transporter permease subunit n=1 Tax=Isoptericola haloaureus TaxID=1542902 RepID=A0ABU7ZBN5_9MICO
MRLLRVELRRLWMRRVTWGGLLLALVVAGLGVAGQIGSAQPPTDRQVAEAEAFYAEELERWEENGEQQVEQCEEAEAEAAADDPGADFGCDDMAPRLEYFLPPTVSFVPDADDREAAAFGVPPDRGESQDPRVAEIEQSLWTGWSGVGAAAGYAPAFLMLAFVVGVSFMTAERSTGALGMWLTFEPRRSRVYGSKALAAALGTVPLVVAGWVAVAGGIYTLHAVFGTVGPVAAEDWVEIGAFSARLVVAGVLCAAVGTALGVLLRHAVAAVGAVAVVLWAGAVFGYPLGAAQRWTPTTNLTAWLEGGTAYGVAQELRDETGMVTTTWTTEVVTGLQGGLYLLAVAAVLTLLAVVVFRRRDVA